MNKSLIVLVLILVIAGQLIVLSSFHEVDDSEIVVNNAVLTVAKWNFVDATLTLSVSPLTFNGTRTTVELVDPNGTSINLTATSDQVTQTFTQRFSFPKTGDFFSSEAVNNGKITLSPDKPLAILLSEDVGNVQEYISSMSLSDYPNVNEYTFIIYGSAQVSFSGCGVTL